MKPTLLVDVDGVLNPFGFQETPYGFTEYEMFPEDDYPVLLSDTHGQWLHELNGVYRMVWATGWGEEANRLISPLFGFERWPTIPFPPIPFPPSEKVPAVERFIGNQSCAWLEDDMTKEAYDWAGKRQEPTLLINVNPAVGMTRDMVDGLMQWIEVVSESDK